MSLQTWKDEFYPVPANQVPENLALDHSIRKWEGLRAENLAKHELMVVKNTIGDYCKLEAFDSPERVNQFRKAALFIDSNTCALCVHHLGKWRNVDARCQTCPLFLVRKGISCDSVNLFGSNPYRTWLKSHDPLPMIVLLKEAKEKGA